MAYLPFAIGVLLLIGVGIIIWWRPSENAPVTIMFLAGMVLIVLSSDDKAIKAKFGSSGFEFERAIQDAKVDYAGQIAKLASELEAQKQITAEHSKLFQTQQTAGAPKPAALERVDEIKNKFSEKSKYSVLVFFRDGQRNVAEKLTKTLVEAGYQSSATVTDLTEVVPALAGDRQSGRVVVAATSPHLPILNEVRKLVEDLVTVSGLKKPFVSEENWAFRRGDIQIYVF